MLKRKSHDLAGLCVCAQLRGFCLSSTGASRQFPGGTHTAPLKIFTGPVGQQKAFRASSLFQTSRLHCRQRRTRIPMKLAGTGSPTSSIEDQPKLSKVRLKWRRSDKNSTATRKREKEKKKIKLNQMEEGQKRSILSIVISTRDRSDFFFPPRRPSLFYLQIRCHSSQPSTYKMDHIRIRSSRCGSVFSLFPKVTSSFFFLPPVYSFSSLSARHVDQTLSAYLRAKKKKSWKEIR